MTLVFFFNDTATTEIYTDGHTLSLHDALPIWEQALDDGSGDGASGLVIDSAEIRRRFGLGDFAGTLFIHAIGARGHDVVKYAVDTYGDDEAEQIGRAHV